MTIWGWIFLVLSWGFILSLTMFCFYKVLRIEPQDGNNG